MPEVTLRPRAAGSKAEHTPNPGSQPNFVNADADPATWNEAAAAGKEDLFLLDPLPFEAYEVQNLNLLHSQTAKAGSTTVARFRHAAASHDAGAALAGAVVAQDVGQATVARPGGGLWKVGEINVLEAGYSTGAIDLIGDTVKNNDVRAIVQFTIRDPAPFSDGTALVSFADLPQDPVRFKVRIALHADDQAWIDDVAIATITFGPIRLKGYKHPIFLTLSRQSVVIPGA